MKTGHPEISVLMSVYNGETFLREAVESVLNQTFTDFEFIIINDGSTDATSEILASYADERIVLISQENIGLTKSLNKGLSLARGTRIARMDADDISKPHRLEKQVAYVHDNPHVVLLGSNYIKIDEAGNITGRTNLPGEEVLIKWKLLFHNCLCHSSILFHKEKVLDLGGYDSTIYCAQDYDLWTRIAKKYPVAVSAEPLVCFREPRAGAITIDKADEQTRQAQNISVAVLQDLNPEYGTRQEKLRSFSCFMCDKSAEGSLEDAEKVFLSTLSAFPGLPFADTPRDMHLKTIRARTYIKFAWAHYAQGSLENFNRCIHEAMACGLRSSIDIPVDDLGAAEPYLFNALYAFFSKNRQSMEEKERRDDFLSNQYIHLAWKYHARDDMKNFRRCIVQSLKKRLCIRVAFLFIKSLLGKKLWEKLA